MTEEKILEYMMELGLNKYESKAYVALLKKPEITAYELSKVSGVPQAKIYETMNKLLERNLVNVVGDNPVKYVAIDFNLFLNNYQKSVEEKVSFLKDNLESVQSPQKVSYLWHLEGKENIMQKIKYILKNTKKNAYIEAWEEEYRELQDDLTDMKENGIEILSVLYGKPKKEIGIIYNHEMEGMEENAREVGRWFTLVSDGRESIFAVFKPGGIEQGVWTENRAFMLMAESFIAHDIYMAEIYKKYKKRLDEDFGPNMESIRKKIKF